MRFQKIARVSSKSAESSWSGSALNTISHLELNSPVSRKASSDQSDEQKHQEMMASDSHGTGGAPTHQPGTQGKASSTRMKDGKIQDSKTLRRLAQNREAAKKSRLRKKAYVQQLECSRIRLQYLEHELQRVQSQGLLSGGDSGNAISSSGATTFDMEYASWLDKDCKCMSKLRAGLQAQLPDHDLRIIINECLAHYDDIFRLKSLVAKSDVFHLISGTWLTPAERCFLWMGGFRPSELLKILMAQLDLLTEQQLMGICNLQQLSQQAEEALSQGLDQLHRSLADTVVSSCSLSDGADLAYRMGHMANVALGQLDNLQGFVQQADNLRQQTLHQICQILDMRQAARCFLSMAEYKTRLRAISSLWVSPPRE